jgi:hypothetical protein
MADPRRRQNNTFPSRHTYWLPDDKRTTKDWEHKINPKRLSEHRRPQIDKKMNVRQMNVRDAAEIKTKLRCKNVTDDTYNDRPPPQCTTKPTAKSGTAVNVDRKLERKFIPENTSMLTKDLRQEGSHIQGGS